MEKESSRGYLKKNFENVIFCTRRFFQCKLLKSVTVLQEKARVLHSSRRIQCWMQCRWSMEV